MHVSHSRLKLLGILSLVLSSLPSIALEFQATKIAKSGDSPPGALGAFFNFEAPIISETGEIAFQSKAASSNQPTGVYLFEEGVLKLVADSSVPVPGLSGFNFAQLGRPAIYQDEVAFFGRVSGHRGIYRYRNGGIEVVADVTTNFPEGEGTFGEFAEKVAISSGGVAFQGEGDLIIVGEDQIRQEGLFTANASHSLITIADHNTALPDGIGNFQVWLEWELTGSTATFLGAGQTFFEPDQPPPPGQWGIFSGSGGDSVNLVINDKATLPGIPEPVLGNIFGENTFSAFGELYVVKIENSTTQPQGIYLLQGGNTTALVTTDSAIPENETDTFGRFEYPTLYGSDVVFWAQNSDFTVDGLYLYDGDGSDGGGLHKIIETGDTLDDAEVTFVGADVGAFNGTSIVATIHTRNTERIERAVFQFDPAEPGVNTLTLLADIALHSSNAVQLSWESPPDTPEATYRIERSTELDNWTTIPGFESITTTEEEVPFDEDPVFFRISANTEEETD